MKDAGAGSLYGRMRARGLVDVRAEARLSMWYGDLPVPPSRVQISSSFTMRELSADLFRRKNFSKMLQGSTIRTSRCRRRSCGRHGGGARQHSNALLGSHARPATARRALASPPGASTLRLSPARNGCGSASLVLPAVALQRKELCHNLHRLFVSSL